MISDVTFLLNDAGDYNERPTIAIAPENVTVVFDEETAPDDHDHSSSVSKQSAFIVV